MLIKWQRKLTTLKKRPLSKQNDIIITYYRTNVPASRCEVAMESQAKLPVVFQLYMYI